MDFNNILSVLFRSVSTLKSNQSFSVIWTFLLIAVISSLGIHCGSSGSGSSPASILLTYPDEDFISSSDQLTVTGSASGTDSDSIFVSVNGQESLIQSFQNGEFSHSITLTEGSNTIYAFILNSDETRIETETREIILDTLPPEINFISPSNQETVTTEQIDIVCQISDSSPLADCSLTVNDSSVEFELNGEDGYYYGNVSLVDGTNEATVNAADDLGHSAFSTIEFTLIDNGPSISLLYPSSQTVVCVGSLTLQASISDMSIKNANVIMNGNSQTVSVYNGDISTEISVQLGSNVLIINATDSLGNSASTGEIEFYGGYRNIYNSELLDKIVDDETFILIDARPSDDFTLAHIDNAINVTADDIASQAEDIIDTAGGNPIIAYSEDHVDAENVLRQLYRQGATELFLLVGGINSWTSSIPVRFPSNDSVTIQVGNTHQFIAYGGLVPYSWSVCNTSYGDIDDQGLYTAISPGSCAVWVYGADGSSDYIPILILE